MRFFCPYDVDTYSGNSEDPNYNPYQKFELIRSTLMQNINRLLLPAQKLSYDEGGKPYEGKGGEGRLKLQGFFLFRYDVDRIPGPQNIGLSKTR